MAEKVTLEKVFIDKLETKYGVKDRVSIYTLEHEGVKMTSFDKPALKFKTGDVVEVEIEQKGQYMNFKVPGAGRSATPTSDLEGRVARLEKAVFQKGEDVIEVADNNDDDF